MTCPRCDTKLKCIETRARKNVVHRRYACPKCDERYSTIEDFVRTEAPPVKQEPQAAKQAELTSSTLSHEEIKRRLHHPWNYK